MSGAVKAGPGLFEVVDELLQSSDSAVERWPGTSRRLEWRWVSGSKDHVRERVNSHVNSFDLKDRVAYQSLCPQRTS